MTFEFLAVGNSAAQHMVWPCMSRAGSEGNMGYPCRELLTVVCTAACAAKNAQAVQ